MVVWIKTRNGESIRFVDKWQNSIYVSADSKTALEWLARHGRIQPYIASTEFVRKREHVFDYDEREVLKLVLKRAEEAERLAKIVEGCSGYGDFRIYNADILPAQAYFIEKNIFALALVKAEKVGETISWKLLDFIEAEEYELPPLKKAILRVEVNASRAIPKFSDPIRKITIFADETVEIEEGDERSKLLSLVEAVKKLDPDLLFIEKGDAFTTHYLAERASVNGILSKLILSRDPIPLRILQKRGTSYFVYGRIMHTPTSHQLYGRINLDSDNFFAFEEAGLDGLFEVARLCRMPLHKGSRASIGKCLSSMQFAIAHEDNLLIPWKPTRAEVPKTGRVLLAGDRGGFIYEPKIGVHEYVGEIDFTSLYPYIMVKYNISAETVLCKCCKDSKIRVPDVNYNICEKRKGIIPKSLQLMLKKRVSHKEKRNKTDDPELKRRYGSRVDALKGIGVCSFGYLSYRNAKFGLIDCHIAVCAFARKILLETATIAERRGFEVVHGIVDSLWVKKPRAEKEDFEDLRREIEDEIGLPISFEGIYKWIAFLPSRMHEDVPVLNRYFGVFEDDRMKLRGIELRRRDTIKLVADCQRDILETFTFAEDAEGVRNLLPEAIRILKSYVELIRDGKIPLNDLIIVNSLSKNFNEYTSNISQAAAVKLLAEEGLELMAGQSVSYVITKFKSRNPREKVRPVQLLNTSIKYDKERYVELLVRGVASILQPFGYDERQLADIAGSGSRQAELSSYL
ncbi:MAG TPA: DNA polymerase domain-containing protein [Nitrososphaerales archaeon]